MSRPHLSRRTLVPLALTCAVLVAAGCSTPGSDNSSSNNTPKPSSAVSTNPDVAGDVTLRVWDQEVRGGQNKQMTQLNKEFEAKYPNVTIERTSKSFKDLKTTLKLALTGDDPPDVVEVNQGYPDMVAFVNAGMLVPLDGYAKVYGWDKRYPSSLLDLNRVSKDGKHFGTGTLYGVSQMGEYVGIYYNKAKLKSLGLDPPKTWSEFTAELAKIKAAGDIPIQFGNLDKWPAIHTFGVIQGQIAGKGTVRDLVFGTGNAAWTDDATVQAATTLQDWAKKGYFPKGVNGIGYDDSNKNFAAGQGVFNITGTWEAAVLEPSMGSKLGLMLPPPAAAGGKPVTTGGESLSLAITSKSDHPDVAASYIDFLTNAHADDVMTKTGNLAAIPSGASKKLEPSSVDGQMVAGWKQVSNADGLVPYLDYSTPTFYDTLTAELQKLIGGQETPEEFTQALQDDYTSFHQK
ncbi:MAG: ABC transporter substrate-binding protein [Nocardioidaceae bacterium]